MLKNNVLAELFRTPVINNFEFIFIVFFYVLEFNKKFNVKVEVI